MNGRTTAAVAAAVLSAFPTATPGRLVDWHRVSTKSRNERENRKRRRKIALQSKRKNRRRA